MSAVQMSFSDAEKLGANSAEFFNDIRGMFAGGLDQKQVKAIELLCSYAQKNGYSRLHTAYVLATVFHETGGWMQPLREGEWRHGPGSLTDAQSRRAVARLKNEGVISRNYALPDAITGHSYYGRGLVQTTHKDNYQKISVLVGRDCVNNPDLLLDWDISVAATFIAMKDGMYRAGKNLSMIASTKDFYKARDIINGDLEKNGSMIARYAVTFYNALEHWPATVEETAPMTEQVDEVVVSPRESYDPTIIAALGMLIVAVVGTFAWKKGWLEGVRYIRPASLTWWASFTSIMLGVTQLLCAVCDFGEFSKLIGMLQGATDTSPASLIMLGLVGIGLNDKLARADQLSASSRQTVAGDLQAKETRNA